MRSFAYTFVLAVLAALVGAATVWHWRSGNLDSWFGEAPVPVGAPLYDNFRPAEVKNIRISSKGVTATFVLGPDGWRATSPWDDRMDARAAVAIIGFALGMRVHDHAENSSVDPNVSGFGDAAVSVRLEGADHTPLAKFLIGRTTPLKAEVEGADEPVPTVYVMPRDKFHKRHLYACTGDISPLFKNGLVFLRDHHPFYFNPAALKTIAIRSKQGELTLSRDRPESPWRIVKPLDLPTDSAAVKTLLEGLFELRAVKIAEVPSAVPAGGDKVTGTEQISIASFGSGPEIVLDMTLPENPADPVAKATVSNRPGIVFDLPLRPEAGLVSLGELPLSVNDLRNPTLTHLHVPSIAAISIQPATSPEIILFRKPGKPWMVETGGDAAPIEANEENLFALLKAVTAGRATGFVSDAATDFSPWGLDRPVLRLRFLGVDDSVLELRFGVDKEGGHFVNRLGSPTVMRVDSALVASIAVRGYQWRHGRLWSLDPNNPVSIERVIQGAKPEAIKYVMARDEWVAGSDTGGGILDPMRAIFLFNTLQELKVTRWLSPDDLACSDAMLNPSLTINVMEKLLDEDLEDKGFTHRTLVLAPASRIGTPAFYYGRVNSESHPFIISREFYQKLTVPLFEK